MLKVGLTGNAGAGKSTVARIWRDERGAFVIDADHLGAEAVAPGTPALAALVERFGPRMLRDDGGLDRGRMARIAFNDPEDLAALNSIVHPEILRRVDDLLAEAEAAGVDMAVVDAALIYEFGLEKKLDCVVLVDAPLDVRRERVLEKGKMDAATFERVVAAQLPAEELRKRADYVIENGGDRKILQRRALEVYEKMLRGE
jgi:dephospho-CoA kinase